MLLLGDKDLPPPLPHAGPLSLPFICWPRCSSRLCRLGKEPTGAPGEAAATQRFDTGPGAVKGSLMTPWQRLGRAVAVAGILALGIGLSRAHGGTQPPGAGARGGP